VQADVVIRAAEPGSRSEDETWFAAGVKIGRVRTYIAGGKGGQETTFGQDDELAGEELAKARRTAVMHEVLDLERMYKEIKVECSTKPGAESVYLLRLMPAVGKASVLHVSARTGLIVRREGDGEVATHGDFRRVDGEIVPFRTTVEEALGTVSTEVKEVRFNVALPTGAFGKMTTLR
jgi:hypothetical protein